MDRSDVRWGEGGREIGKGREEERKGEGGGGKKLRATDVWPLDIKECTAFMGKAGKQRREGEGRSSTETEPGNASAARISPYFYFL
jgi:hypothetical protein